MAFDLYGCHFSACHTPSIAIVTSPFRHTLALCMIGLLRPAMLQTHILTIQNNYSIPSVECQCSDLIHSVKTDVILESISVESVSD